MMLNSKVAIEEENEACNVRYGQFFIMYHWWSRSSETLCCLMERTKVATKKGLVMSVSVKSIDME